MAEATPAATPTEQKPDGTPPVAPVATPAEENTVVLKKEEHDQLKRDAARTAASDRENKRLRKLAGLDETGHFPARKAQPVPTPPSEEDAQAQALAEDRKAADGLRRIAIDPQFRKVLDADQTLAALFKDNPIAVLPLLAPDALDAEDALELVTEKLTERLTKITEAEKPPVNPPPAPVVPPAGAPNAQPTDAAYEDAKKIPNTDKAITEMIKIGLGKLPGNKNA